MSILNGYFINVGKSPNLGDDLQKEGVNDCLKEVDPYKFKKLTEKEVFKVVKDINISKSSGIDNISSHIIKETFLALIPEVTHLFNLSLTSRIFPRAWKDALVIPIPKTGDLSKVKNFRPISLSPIPGKMLEKLVHTQLMSFFEENEILTNVQHGFRKGHSTVHSIAQLVNHVSAKMDSGIPTLVAFVDFRKAFDCVQHELLLKKLEHSGVDEGVAEWVRSYLTQRRKLTQCNVAQYAHDTVLYTANPNFMLSIKKLQ